MIRAILLIELVTVEVIAMVIALIVMVIAMIVITTMVMTIMVMAVVVLAEMAIMTLLLPPAFAASLLTVPAWPLMLHVHLLQTSAQAEATETYATGVD